MNTIICIFSVYYFFKLVDKRISIGIGSKVLIYMGILMPIGDYVFRLVLGEIWFHTSGLIFHSFFYQGLFWSISALLFWVYRRDVKGAGRLLLPLVGLSIYALFTILGTESVAFLGPITLYSIHLDWIGSGYLIPLAVYILLLISKKWSDLSLYAIGRLSLGFLFLFFIYVGIVRYNIERSLDDSFQRHGSIVITPANSLQTVWNAVVKENNHYLSRKYHFIRGWQGEIQKHQISNDFEISQSVLLDPLVRLLYQNALKNPMLNADIQNEVLKVEISELFPSIEPLWIAKIKITKNRSGQLLDFSVDYGSIF
ncbi:MAG: hypothetical protein GY866_39635 [Proteobacteria bacterium]|nr:hypothetical protein [Pseudomonadota bacterium]